LVKRAAAVGRRRVLINPATLIGGYDID